MTTSALSPPLLDAEARTAFITGLDENFCVSAGAGAGKTTAIVRRIANLAVERQRSPGLLSRLVVVTYGKLAAEELRVRTRDLVLQQLAPTAAGRQTLLADLRGAFFGTIHSFCLKLIRDHGRPLGLPAELGLLEERDTFPLWERFCESEALLALDLSTHLLDQVSRHLTFDQLLELAREFGPGETAPAADFDPAAAPPALDFSVALQDDGGRSRDKTREHQAHLRRWEEEFAAGAAFLQLPHYSGGSRSFLAAVEAALAPYARWLNGAAGCLAARIAQAFRDYRLARGLVTYPDQVFWCRQLLAQPAILTRLRQREYIVILDEAQDTDLDMFAILTEITRPVSAGLGGWPGRTGEEGPLPGRFSFVGDDQQAIYSERADLRVYRQYIDAYKAGAGGRYLEFSVTMRCPERVIGAVNGIFAEDRIQQAHVRFRALQPRPACPTGGAWRLDLGEIDDPSQKAEPRFLRECAQVAAFVAARGPAGLGIGGWAQLAILAPRIDWLEIAAEVFASHGLPGSLLSHKRLARESPRHSWPAALLHVLVHPWDRFELIGVLRELFAVSDVDMARLHRAAGINGNPGLSFWPRIPEPPGKGKVPAERLHRALALLHQLRAAFPDHPAGETLPGKLSSAASGGTLSRYVDYVLTETALAARLEAVGEPAACLDLFRARAMQAECAGLTLRAWTRALVAALHDPIPGQTDEPDAIQFLTCQKAKGLEWPVVIPLGMGREIRSRREQFPRVERQDGRTVIHFSSVTVDAERKKDRTERAAEEFERMLYVTLTRARRLLIVPDGSRIYDNQPPNFQRLARWQELDLARLFSAADSAQVEPHASPAAATPVVAWFHEDPALLLRAGEVSRQIPQRILPSSLVHIAPGEERVVAQPAEAEARDSESIVLARAAVDDEPLTTVGGIEYGNWWHAVLQHYPWAAAAAATRAEYLLAALALIPPTAPWIDRARGELARFRASAAHAQLLAAGGVYLAELPFSFPRGPAEWVEGIMDLVVIPAPGEDIWVIDWKTDRRRSSDENEHTFCERLAEKYGPQLRAYAGVFVAGFQRKVGRLLLYSTEQGELISIPV